MGKEVVSVSREEQLAAFAGHVHTFESFGRAVIAGALQRAAGADNEQGEPYEFKTKISVTLFPDCFEVSEGEYTDDQGVIHRNRFRRCHGGEGDLVN